jgi:ATP/ADP translocase
MIRASTLIGKVFNINRGEWSRVAFSWFINFFYRIGFVIGWTIIVGMFVGKYGIYMLPFLFVWNGLFTIIGTAIYSTFINKISKEKIILISIVFALLFLALAVIFKGYNETLFFGLLLVAEALFLVQLKIAANGLVETLFTPLESERTFSFIESAEIIAGIVAGVLVTFFASAIEPSAFVYLWMVSLIFIFPCLLYHKSILKGVYRFNLEEEKNNDSTSVIERIKEVASQVRHISFIKGLFFVVGLQWIFANLIEFQYTKAVYENIPNAIMTSGSGFEHALVHDLGALFILFSVCALVIQLFVGGRLITSLGIIGSMLLYPIVMLLSVFGLTVKFGFPTAVLAQTNRNITNVIYMNSYHSAYYSVKEHFREHTREFLEGVIRPVGAIIGTLMLIGLQKFFTSVDLTLSVNLTMIFVLILLLIVTYGLQGKYTKIACYNLLSSDDKFDKIEAIDILSQKGHKLAFPVLKKVLNDPKESDYVKIKILHALGELQEFDAIDDIIGLFDSKKADIRLAAVESLLKFRSVSHFFLKHVFHEYKMAEALKTLYKKEKSEEIRSIIIHLLSRLNPIGTFGFLLKVLKSAKGNLRIDVIVALGKYRDDHVVAYIKPFLESRRPIEKAAAIISLWKFAEDSDDYELILDKMLNNKNSNVKKAAIYAVGELKLKSKQKYCKECLSSTNKEMRVDSAIALTKMGYFDSVKTIVELLFNEDQIFVNGIKRAIKKLPHKVGKMVEKEVKQIVSARINDFIAKTKVKSLEYLNIRYLKYLKILYSLVEENEEVELINELIYAKKYS